MNHWSTILYIDGQRILRAEHQHFSSYHLNLLHAYADDGQSFLSVIGEVKHLLDFDSSSILISILTAILTIMNRRRIVDSAESLRIAVPPLEEELRRIDGSESTQNRYPPLSSFGPLSMTLLQRITGASAFRRCARLLIILPRLQRAQNLVHPL
jgi:hypothetical protein